MPQPLLFHPGQRHANPLNLPTFRLLRFLVAAAIVSFCLAELINISKPRLGPLHRYHLNPFNVPSQTERFSFDDTAREQQCYNGSIKDTSRIPGPIPNVVHLVMVVKQPDVDPSPGQLTFMDWLCITAALKVIRPDQIKLHYTWIDTENVWYKKVKDSITLVHHELSDIEMIKPTWHPAHMADVLRLQVLINEGGIYMDRDIITLRPFANLLTGVRDTILGFEGGAHEGLGNALIVSKRASPFLVRWLAKYDTLDDSVWNYHSVILPGQMAKQYPDDLCELSPTAFFYPTWTDSHVEYMHMELNPTEASHFEDDVRANGGAIYKNQMAYHATNGLHLLEELTPDQIKQKETRFNMLVRQFLD